MPSRKLRGFQRGKVGPVDSNDYVGGNYVSSVNFAATLPNVMPNWQTADFSVFFDAGNVWGVLLKIQRKCKRETKGTARLPGN